MTLCIAAISERDRCIVTVSDLMLSTEFMSSEAGSMLKSDVIPPHHRWIMLFAGDPTVRGGVLRRVEQLVADCSQTAPEMMIAVETAFRDELKRKIDGEVLGAYGLDRDAFLGKRDLLGDDIFSRVWYQIAATELETDFLVAGFEPSGWPRLFCVSDPGVAEEHALGFHAIGSGARLALGALASTYDSDLGVTDLIYRLCEAKFLGEKARTVGEKTVVTVQYWDRKPYNWQWIRFEHAAPIRDAWKRQGWPPIPADAHLAITAGLSDIIAWKYKR